MPRIRTTKPEFWSSEQVVECDPLARLMFMGMWNFCDDQGVHPASTKRLKMEVFPGDPYTDELIQKWIDQLIEHSLIIQYEAAGKQYWWVTGWHHQKIARPSNKYPPPPIQCSFNAHSVNEHEPITEPHPPDVDVDVDVEGKRKGTEGSILPTDAGEAVPVPKLPTVEEIYQAYPKKVGKGKAEKAIKSALKKIPADELLSAVEEFTRLTEGSDRQFTPYPASWFNAESWKDDRDVWRSMGRNNRAGPQIDSGQRYNPSKPIDPKF